MTSWESPGCALAVYAMMSWRPGPKTAPKTKFFSCSSSAETDGRTARTARQDKLLAKAGCLSFLLPPFQHKAEPPPPPPPPPPLEQLRRPFPNTHHHYIHYILTYTTLPILGLLFSLPFITPLLHNKLLYHFAFVCSFDLYLLLSH
ncbi:hypothetical protein TWF706_012025 [Orbilia oligospora]|nr:hypothetical protein TWF706_012025 [Orbilia oligospora]